MRQEVKLYETDSSVKDMETLIIKKNKLVDKKHSFVQDIMKKTMENAKNELNVHTSKSEMFTIDAHINDAYTGISTYSEREFGNIHKEIDLMEELVNLKASEYHQRVFNISDKQLDKPMTKNFIKRGGNNTIFHYTDMHSKLKAKYISDLAYFGYFPMSVYVEIYKEQEDMLSIHIDDLTKKIENILSIQNFDVEISFLENIKEIIFSEKKSVAKTTQSIAYKGGKTTGKTTRRKKNRKQPPKPNKKYSTKKERDIDQ